MLAKRGRFLHRSAHFAITCGSIATNQAHKPIRKIAQLVRTVARRCESYLLPCPADAMIPTDPRQPGDAAEEILVEQEKEYVEQCGKKCQVRTDQDGTKYVLVTLIETRGEGGLFLCCPTPGYELVQGDFAQLPVLTEAERETVLRAAWELNEYWSEPLPTPVYNGAALPFGEQHRPGDDFDTRGDVRAVLRAHGWPTTIILPVSRNCSNCSASTGSTEWPKRLRS